MKRIISLLIAAAVLLTLLCGCEIHQTEYRYGELSSVDHAVTEPDERETLGDKGAKNYRRLVDAVLCREESCAVDPGEAGPSFFTELLKENPYGFLLSDITWRDGAFWLSYAYDAAEQEEIVALMDETILSLLNRDASEKDNKLDKILKLYHSVTEYVGYDHSTSEITPLTDTHLRYPGDSVYRALREKTAKCYGFSYLFTFLMLQYDLDCFSVYGTCRSRGDSHMWNLFAYDGAYFYCDPAWDRSDDAYSKLINFGKTLAEREAEKVEAVPFEQYHEKGFEPPVCDDARFSLFRGIVRFSYISSHRFYMQDFDENDYTFNTETFAFQ